MKHRVPSNEELCLLAGEIRAMPPVYSIALYTGRDYFIN